jgi:hypothetical protein
VHLLANARRDHIGRSVRTSVRHELSGIDAIESGRIARSDLRELGERVAHLDGGVEVGDELDAEHLISAWEREAKSRGLDRYSGQFWAEAEDWIAAQR